MSRSYKKAVLKDHGKGTYIDKRFASKAVRRFKGDVSDNGWFKKVFCSWNISDYTVDNRYLKEPKWYMRGAKKKDDGWEIPK